MNRREHWRVVVRQPKKREKWLMLDVLPPTGWINPQTGRGGAQRWSTYTMDEAKAQQIAREKENELNGVIVVREGTFLEFWDAYTAYREADAHSPEGCTAIGSLEKFKTIRAALLPHIGTMKMREIDEIVLVRVQDRLRAKPLAARTINAYFGMLREGWRWGRKRGFVSCDMPNIDRLQETNTKKRPFTKDECERILRTALEYVGGRWYPVLRFVYETGCRSSEACGLRERDVDRTHGVEIDGVLLWPVTLNAASGTNTRNAKKKRRVVYVDETTLNLIPKRTGDEFVFGEIDRKALHQAFVRICDYRAIEHDDVDMHSFRRKWVRDATRTPGLAPVVARKFTGHSNARVFEQYQANDIEDQMADVAASVRRFRASPSASRVEREASASPETVSLSSGSDRADRSVRKSSQVADVPRSALLPPSLSCRAVSGATGGSDGEGRGLSELLTKIASLSDAERQELVERLTRAKPASGDGG
jgi:integrase